MSRKVSLAEVLEAFETGKRPKGGAVADGIPSLGGEHVTAEGTLKLDSMRFVPSEFFESMTKGRLRAGDVLVVKDGATTGRVGMVEETFPFERAGVNEHLFLLRADQRRLDPRFLYFYLRSFEGQAELMSDFRGAAQGGISREIGHKVRVPLPSLTQQRRIVDLLTRAEGVVRLRREAKAKAAEIIPALFLDMFGDPSTNPKGWEVVSLGEQVVIPSVVRTPDPAADADRLCIGADSIESGTGRLLTLPTVREVKPRSGKYWFERGDVLYSKIRPNLAKAALARSDGFCSADMYPLRCSRTTERRFLLSLLLTKAFTEFATSESVRAQMPKLNRETLFAYRFPLPPTTLQTRFAQFAEQVESVECQQADALQQAEAAFSSLLARVFASNPEGTSALQQEAAVA
jgi:type I restriction enzyme S subunit